MKPEVWGSKHSESHEHARVRAAGGEQLSDWECVQVSHHKDVGNTIAEWEQKGWTLHTYQATGSPTAVNHYLLFKRGVNLKGSITPL